MSAPLAVNTKDGVCWTRRTVTSSGIALYAPEGVCRCPEFVMATLAELAEHGITGQADVLPMPAGREPQARMSLKAARGRLAQYGSRTSTWSTATYDSGTEKALHEIAVTLLGEVDRLLDERHSTNEALDDAVKALRARQVPDVDRSVDKLTRLLAPTQALREDEAADGDRFVAYLAGGSGFLYCVNCCHGSGMYAPMTSDDLPNGGMCNGCGVDVLIEQPATGGA